jgi:hypothetical protein
MITFSRIGNFGRLGNQLFQYAILLAVGYKNNYTIKIPNMNNRIHHGQNCLLRYFNISADTLTENDVIKYNYAEKRVDKQRIYDPRVFDIEDNTDIIGYFQSYLYYKDAIDLIKKELTVKDDILNKNKEIIEKIKSDNLGYEIISLHLRRGDTDLNMYGNGKSMKKSPWFKYFTKAKKEFKNKKVKFLVFSGGNITNDVECPDKDYNWCRNNLIGDEYIYTEGDNHPIDDFTLMQLCDHHILSPSSTFSWWVGCLSPDNHMVIAPSEYIKLTHSVGNGFYPPKYKII